MHERERKTNKNASFLAVEFVAVLLQDIIFMCTPPGAVLCWNKIYSEAEIGGGEFLTMGLA